MNEPLQTGRPALRQAVGTAREHGRRAAEPDEEVAALFEHAATVIFRRGDAAGAVVSLARAAELSAEAGERARRIGTAAHLGVTFTGDLHGAAVMLTGSETVLPSSHECLETALADAAVLVYADGDVLAGHRVVAQALADSAGQPVPPATFENLLRTLMVIGLFAGRADVWNTFHAAVASGGEHGERLGCIGRIVADPALATAPDLERLESDIAALSQTTDPSRVLQTAGAAAWADRLPGCRRALRRVGREAEEQGAHTIVVYTDTTLSWDAYRSGEWDEARALAQAAVERADRWGYHLLRWHGLLISACIAADQGDTEGAETAAEAMDRWATPRSARLVSLSAQFVRLRMAMARSDFEAGYRHAAAICPPGRLEPHAPHAAWSVLDFAEAAWRTGRQAEALAHVAAVREAGAAAMSSRLWLLVEAATAVTEDDAAALPRFERCLAAADIDRWPFEAARVHLLHGERLRRNREMSAARVHLEEALDGFRRLGAGPWADRAVKELRAIGQVRPRPERNTQEPLTAQEMEIALLAAKGLSNKQIGELLFLSHRTVGAHLYRTFPKLGIKSRAALRDALADFDQ